MTDFLLELRSEEIPARMQDRAREDLARLFAAEIARAGLVAGGIVTYATPRRLALIARDLPPETAAVSEEVKGPKASAPPQALEGFLRKTGLTREQLTERDGVLFAVTEKPGRATAAVLAEAIATIVRGFPWPKSMRWGAASTSTESIRWVRPLQGIVALFGEEIVPVEIAGIVSGATTYGHRFHHPGPITIGSAADYADKLAACHVLIDQAERRDLIRARATALAAEAGLTLVEDEGLVGENAGLTEWPVPLLGRFEADFLQVPPEVIQLTARVNQKYFVCRNADGALANAFVCTANIEASDGGARIVEGNRKVLAARLADARFFYETDLKVPLGEQAGKLDKIVFHEKLGTVADKVDRVAKLARWLVEEGIVSSSPLLSGEGQGASAPRGEGRVDADAALTLPLGSAERDPPSPDGRGELADFAERAARLAKADLVTGMVGEFPELQGLVGGYYAAAQGEHPAVAAAIRDHYKPVGQGDAVPTDPVTVAVSLADKLDTIVGFFVESEQPSGSRDPFALRRAALSIIRLIITNGLRVGIATTADRSLHYHQWGALASAHVSDVLPFRDHPNVHIEHDGGMITVFVGDDPVFGPVEFKSPSLARFDRMMKVYDAGSIVVPFFADRLKVQQREAGVRHDLIDAVFAQGGEDDLVRLLARVRALQAFVGTEDGENLLAGYKRAANILKKEGYAEAAPRPAKEGLGVGAQPAGSVLAAGDGRDPAGRAPTPDPSLEGRGEETLPYTPEPAETALHAALDAAEPAAAAAIEAEDFERAMAALATLRVPIDAFFDQVTVNDADPAKRAARLALLDRVRTAVHQVADFSRIEG